MTPLLRGNLGGPDVQGGNTSQGQRSGAEEADCDSLCFQLKFPPTLFVLAKLFLYCLQSASSSLFSFPPALAVLPPCQGCLAAALTS